MPAKDGQLFTYQTRLKLDAAQEHLLDQCADLLSQIERKLFADIAAGKKSTDLKSLYLKQYPITARHFNALRIQVEGKVSSIKEKQKLQIVDTKHKIEANQKRIDKKKISANVLHQKKPLTRKTSIETQSPKVRSRSGQSALMLWLKTTI